MHTLVKKRPRKMSCGKMSVYVYNHGFDHDKLGVEYYVIDNEVHPNVLMSDGKEITVRSFSAYDVDYHSLRVTLNELYELEPIEGWAWEDNYL